MSSDARASTGRFLTADIPGIGGSIKARPEDFLVEELALTEPTGEGEHLAMLVEKRGCSTLELVAILARHFGVKRSAIGYAGLKDKHAITRQVMTVHLPGRSVEDIPFLDHDRVAILWAERHARKLRRGHLAGNRFVIRIRDVEPMRVTDVARALDALERRGLPNRIGEQRFGILGNNHLVGRALILDRPADVVRELLGPSTHDPKAQPEARAAFEAGDFERAWTLFPRMLNTERRLAKMLADGVDEATAVKRMDPTVRSFHISAFQSAIFNDVLDRRLEAGTFDALREGDIAMKAPGRACFRVDRAVLDDPETDTRLRAHEINPTGPMWGPSMMRTEGDVDTMEHDALTSTNVGIDDLEAYASTHRNPEGERRPLRVQVRLPDVEAGVDEHGPFIRVSFELPRGAFATTLLHELMKDQP